MVISGQACIYCTWKNVIWPGEAQEVKEKVSLWLWTDDADSEFIHNERPAYQHVIPLTACTLKGLSVKRAHNALPKVCGKMTWVIIVQSFPNREGQFHTFQPSQLAFVHPIWHSHNAHMFQMPPSSLFLQFCVCLLSKGLSLPSVLSLDANCTLGEKWRL